MQEQDRHTECGKVKYITEAEKKTATPIWKKPQDWEELTDCVVHTVDTDIIRFSRAYPKGRTAENNCEKLTRLHLHITGKCTLHMRLLKSKET